MSRCISIVVMVDVPFACDVMWFWGYYFPLAKSTTSEGAASEIEIQRVQEEEEEQKEEDVNSIVQEVIDEMISTVIQGNNMHVATSLHTVSIWFMYWTLSMHQSLWNHLKIEWEYFQLCLLKGHQWSQCHWFLRGDKVSMLTYTCPHKPPRKMKVIICNHQADSLLCVAWCLIWWFANLKRMVIHDTECPYWDQVS